MQVTNQMISDEISNEILDTIDLCDEIVLWQTDGDFTITSLSQALFDLTGYNRNELIGNKLNLILKEDNPKSWQELSHCHSEFQDLKFKMKSANGVYIHFNAFGKVHKKQNNIIGYSGFFLIETEKVLTKKAIKRLQTTNKAILESLSEALVIIDENEQFLVVSPEFNQMWGFEKGEIYIHSLEEISKRMLGKLSNNQKPPAMSFICNFDTPKNTKDTLRFSDGRIIERRSTPLIRNQRFSGTCWYFKDITQQTQLLKRLGNLAFRDSLTKLYNRRWCEKKLKQFLRNPNLDSLTFMYMDLDYFKVINDSCGHIHGDDVLVEISRLLQESTGKDAFLARLGGDEFGLILINNSEKQVLETAKNIKAAIADYTYQWKSKIFKLGISIGIVFVKEEDDFRSVFIHSDEACYISKTTGKNKFTVYNADSQEFQDSQTELRWYDEIQKALLISKFELWCQPITDKTNSKPKHFEILLRMINTEGYPISPALFMSSAERFGMILQIDQLVISSFCQFYNQHREKLSGILFSINLSGFSISKDEFLNFVLGTLNQYNIDGSIVCFEITENEIIQNIDKAMDFIRGVKNIGCQISLDDFGKGLTSFSYLKNIDFDYIKIDGQFIKDIDENKINEVIIKSVVDIARVTNKQTVAEHIENNELYQRVVGLGVDFFQGYHFSRPHQITKLVE